MKSNIKEAISSGSVAITILFYLHTAMQVLRVAAVVRSYREGVVSETKHAAFQNVLEC